MSSPKPEDGSIILHEQSLSAIDQNGRADIVSTALKRVAERRQRNLEAQRKNHEILENVEAQKENLTEANFQRGINFQSDHAEELEKFTKAPTTYAQHAVSFMIARKEAIMDHIRHEILGGGKHTIRAIGLASYIMNKHVYPYAASHTKFNTRHIPNAPYPLGIFLQTALSELISDTLVHDYAGELKFYCPKPDERRKCGKDDLSELYSVLEGKLWAKGKDVNNELSLLQVVETIDEMSRYDSFSKPNLKALSQCGFYLFRALKHWKIVDREIDLNRPEEIEALYGEIMAALSGIGEPAAEFEGSEMVKLEEVRESTEAYEEMAKLEAVKSQLKIAFIRRGIKILGDMAVKGRSKEEITQMEKELEFIEKSADKIYQAEDAEEINKSIQEYKDAKSIWQTPLGSLFGGTKSRKTLEKEWNSLEVSTDIMNLYQLLFYIHKVRMAGQILNRSGNPEVSAQGEVLIEIANIYMEDLARIAINIETKLQVGDFDAGDLAKVIPGLASFLHHDSISKIVASSGDLQEQMNLAAAAHDEARALLTVDGQLEEFDQRLNDSDELKEQ